METLIDDNYLTGKLVIVSNVEERYTTGRLTVYIEDEDIIADFLSFAHCADGDEFNKEKGIKIVKLKLADKYYRYMRRITRAKIEKAYRTIKSSEELFNNVNNKLLHISYEISRL